MTFARRSIRVVLTKGGSSPTNPVTQSYEIKDHRVACDIAINGGLTMGNAQVRIYGLSHSLINEFTSIGANYNALRAQNTVSVYAGNENEPLALIFQGQIQYAFGQFQDAPDVYLNIIAYSGLASMLRPVPPTSYNGSVSVGTVMQALAREAGFAFENDGANAQLSSPYLDGPTMYKIRQVHKATGVPYIIHNDVLTIWPAGESRSRTPIEISPGGNMVGYPEVSSTHTFVKAEFLPDAIHGGPVVLKNHDVPVADGKWNTNSVHHSIAAHLPGGPWFTTLGLIRSKTAT